MASLYIIGTDEVRRAIGVDPDYPESEIEALAKQATSFVNRKTGYSAWTDDSPVEPLAVLCATLYVRMIHFGSEGYSKEHDYDLGINGLVEDLKDIARDKTDG